jgi:hypothetical protein
MKQTNTITSGITISNNSTVNPMKNIVSTKYFKSTVVAVLLVISSTITFAQTAGFNGSYLILSANSAADTYYDLNAVTANPDFQGNNLGTFVLGTNTLILKGAEHNVWKCGGCDITATSMNYRIYSTSGTAGSFTSVNIPYSSGFSNGCGGADQQWKSTSANVNVLNGLAAGTYYLEVYEMATTTCTNQYVSNGGGNYKAQFTVSCPTVTISAAGTTSFCPGSSVVLSTTAIAGSTYQWKLSGSNIGANSESYSANQSGVFSLQVTTSLGCVITSNSIPVTVYTAPSATITAESSTTLCPGGSVTLTAPALTGAIYNWKLNGTSMVSGLDNTYSANQNGGYTVTVSSSQGCTSTSSATYVTVASNPTIVVSSSSLESTCGSTVTSTASGAGVSGSYLWSNGGTSAMGSFTSGGTYTVTGTTSAGCTGTASVTVTNGSSTTSNAVAVHYYTEPTASISGTTTVCQNESTNITFTAANNNAGPYTFTYNVNGGTNQTVSTSGSSLTATVVPSTSAAGAYTFTLVSVADAHCSKAYSTGNTAVVTVNPNPLALSLTGSSYCATTSTGGTVVSGTSAIGVNYSLYSNGTVIDGTELSGTGAALTWSSLAAGTSYTVIGTNATTICSSAASNTVAVTASATNNSYVYYLDTDADGYGTGTAVSGCSGTTPTGYSVNTGDCNNLNSAIYPTATELCGNDVDENCSGASDDMPSYYRTIADGNWGDAATWETACVGGLTYTAAAYSPPSTYTGMVNIRSTHDVTIPANGTVYQTGTLDIDAGGSLTMTGNDYLNSPTTTTTNGVTTTNVPQVAKLTVTLLIDNAGTLNIGHQASLVQTSTTASNVGSGNINVQSKLTGSNTAGAPNGRYWYIGSPMNNTVANQFFNTSEMVRLWSYNATNNSWGVVIHSTSNPTVTTDQKLIPGIGYLYRAGVNKTITYTGTAAANLNNNITSNLLAPTQDATLVPVYGYSSSTGYKFVANPYPSYVDWKLVTRTGLNVSYWIRNAANTAYEAFNATTSVSTSPSGQTTQFIPPMQGFWVYAYTTSPAPSLRIDNTDRVHSTNVLHAPVTSQVVRLKLNDGKSSDYAVVYENELASNDFEETDTDKMFDYDFHQLYTMEGEHELSLNGLLNATAKGSVDMGMVVPNNGPYTLEATDLGVEEEVILEDKFNHTFQDLKVNPIYSFTSNAGTFNNRFVLHFTATESVDVAEAATADDVRVFNTSNKQVKVWVSNTAEYQGATVKVYDAIGNLVDRKNMTSNELLLDLDIANGIYVVEVTGAEKTFTKKVFVTK